MIDILEVPGWSGYGVSADGRVWSKRRRGFENPNKAQIWRELKLRVSDTGYLSLSPTRDGKCYTLDAHLWVALVFLGPKPEGFEVNHKDGNKLNSAQSNLEYVTHSQNVDHAYNTGLQPKKVWSEESRRKASERTKKQWSNP